ncbi:MAG: hypothetical protein R3Y29_02920 [bacterium]
MVIFSLLIINSIASQLALIFPSINVYSSFINQSFLYPCFTIQVLSSSQVPALSNRIKSLNSIEVKYYPSGFSNPLISSSDCLAECSNISQLFLYNFTTISLNDNLIRASNLKSSIDTSSVLSLSLDCNFFAINYISSQVDPKAQKMQSISIK